MREGSEHYCGFVKFARIGIFTSPRPATTIPSSCCCPEPEERDSIHFGAGQQPRTEEPQLPSLLGGADGLSFFRQLLGSPEIASCELLPSFSAKPIGVVEQQQERAKVGPASRADRRAPEARLADRAIGMFIVSDQCHAPPQRTAARAAPR